MNEHDVELVGLRDLCTELGVTSRQIHAWHSRGTAGFPEPVEFSTTAAYPGGRTQSPLFDLEAVKQWFAAYDPQKGRGAHWAAKREAQHHSSPDE